MLYYNHSTEKPWELDWNARIWDFGGGQAGFYADLTSYTYLKYAGDGDWGKFELEHGDC